MEQNVYYDWIVDTLDEMADLVETRGLTEVAQGLRATVGLISYELGTERPHRPHQGSPAEGGFRTRFQVISVGCRSGSSRPKTDDKDQGRTTSCKESDSLNPFALRPASMSNEDEKEEVP